MYDEELTLVILSFVIGVLVCFFAMKSARKAKQSNVGFTRMNNRKENYQYLFDACFEPIFFHNGSTFIYANPAAQEAFGAEKWDDLEGVPIIDVVHPDSYELLTNRTEELHKFGKLAPAEYKIKRLDGQVRDFEMSTIVIDHKNLLFQVFAKDISERKLMENRLRESNEQLQHIFDSLDVAIWSTDTLARTRFCSAGIEKIFGYSADKFIKEPEFWKCCIHPDDREKVEGRIPYLIQGEIMVSEYRIVHSSGNIKWVQDRVVPIFDDRNNLIMLDGIVIDITAKKNIEEALAESEAMFRLIAENMNDYLAIIDIHGGLLYKAPSCDKLCNLLEYKTRSVFNWVYHEDIETAGNMITNIVSTGEAQKAEIRCYNDHYGSTIYIEVEGTPIFVPDGTVNRIVVVGRDISDRKRVEVELKLTKENLEHILDSVDVAIWSIDLEDTTMFMSQGIENITGYTTSHFCEQQHPMEIWNDMVYLNDRHIVEQMTHDNLEGKISKQEYRIADRSGNIRWLYDCGYPSFDESGKVVQINGVTLDVTKKKKAEIALRKSEELYRILQTSQDEFSRDVIGVMRVSDLEERLVKEVTRVVNHSSVGIIEIGEHIRIKSGCCDLSLEELNSSLGYIGQVGNLLHVTNGTFIKIGEINGTTYMLWIGNQSDICHTSAVGVWLETITRYVSVWYENLLRIEDLTLALEQFAHNKHTSPWLLRLLFQVSERERRRLSNDLHDSALQELIIWYRRLENLFIPGIPDEHKEEIRQIREGLMDVVYQIRLACNELRPPFLAEWGIVEALESLFKYTQLRSDYTVIFNADQLLVKRRTTDRHVSDCAGNVGECNKTFECR